MLLNCGCPLLNAPKLWGVAHNTERKENIFKYYYSFVLVLIHKKILRLRAGDKNKPI